ncbi:alpha/beta fold hydrolase [Deinococcus aerophilus]|uniref:Alpha/beta hydrolase n=1 Tax=Deinococcus aerophilus TaxID=522488 RepID=A0ABQ2GQP1_9DEIO|nr:alpha/beta hydrolase [Deinococcus aerophilus]GGM07075.1 alpha/beta hydrolase [Deinococcus aerophilus]
MKTDRAQYTPVYGLRTHARVYGHGGPLVIVPGLGCASWMYVRLARELAKGRTVYAYDPPGHGHSEGRPEWPVCLEDLTDHLAAWLDATGLRGSALLGHSIGGEVIFDLAARYPQHAGPLIACSPTGIPENPSVLAQLLRLSLDLPRERLGLLWPGMRAYTRCGTLRMLRLAQDQEDHNTGPLLPAVKQPTLLLSGQADPVIRRWTVQALHTAIPNATIREIVGGTHALMDTFPRTVARFTVDFLDDLEK